MSSANNFVASFSHIDKNDLPSVGGKGANLGEMFKHGFPVPDGFAVTVAAYDKFLEENQLPKKISDILSTVDVHDSVQLEGVSQKIQKLILSSKVPDEVKTAIFKIYRKISGHFTNSFVAVRSSATAEDLPTASFAGQQATFLNIKGAANLAESVRACWASLFTPRAIFYREENKIAHEQVKISVIVQKMVQSEVSGVMFSLDPVSNEKDKIIIEAVWGLGELIVQGSVTPDRYVVQKETFSILSKEISDQTVMLVRDKGKTYEKEVPKKYHGIQKISDDHIVALAKLAVRLHQHYFFPQDIEWASQKNKLYILQTRPVTTTKTSIKSGGKNDETSSLTPLLSGTPASPGIGRGVVKMLKNAGEIGKVKPGDILVAPMTSPDFVPAMKKAEGIITDQGGATSHAAIVSRELGIPCIVGTKTATRDLKDNMVVTIDGTKGQVYLGGSVKIAQTIEKYRDDLNTSTKIYVNLAEPEMVNKVAKLNVDGVGLLRAEFMMADIGDHPKEVIKNKKQDEFVKKLSADIAKFCRAFYPRPVVYRATDFKTNEYRSLKGGKVWEPNESNPMLGFRGAFRYISSPEVFTLELRALKAVQREFDNIRLMIPFVRSPQELAKVRRMTSAEGLFENNNFKFWMMVELPVNIISFEDFVEVGIDGISIGSNDLTMLITGTDRDNSEVASAFDERSSAVLWAIKRVITLANKHKITSSICGQAPSIYDDYAEKLVNFGVTSISVNPDAVNRVRALVYEAEKKK